MTTESTPGALGSNAQLGPLSPLEQLLAFCDWEREHRPHPDGKRHIADWAAAEIERLRAALATEREEARRMCPHEHAVNDWRLHRNEA